MKIMIAAGGSGGHIFPAIALARKLKEDNHETDILFVGSSKAIDRRIFTKEGFRFVLLSANKLPYRPSLAAIPFFIKFIIDTLRALRITVSYSPAAVVGFGGYISCPVMAVAYLLGIPRIIHEQNVVPGRANRFIFKIADRIALTFKETVKFLAPDEAKKAVFTGNPIRQEMLRNDREEGLVKLGLSRDKFTILVIGGSQGAHFLNKTFVEALEGLKENLKVPLQVIHITGVADYEWALKSYAGLGLDHRVYSFIDRIEEAYSACDLVVTRSGASAIFELAVFGKPMILVPYPFAMSHQSENADVFSENGAALKMEEKGLSPESFKDNIGRLIADRSLLDSLSSSVKRLSVPQASESLAREVLSCAGI